MAQWVRFYFSNSIVLRSIARIDQFFFGLKKFSTSRLPPAVISTKSKLHQCSTLEGIFVPYFLASFKSEKFSYLRKGV